MSNMVFTQPQITINRFIVSENNSLMVNLTIENAPISTSLLWYPLRGFTETLEVTLISSKN